MPSALMSINVDAATESRLNTGCMGPKVTAIGATHAPARQIGVALGHATSRPAALQSRSVVKLAQDDSQDGASAMTASTLLSNTLSPLAPGDEMRKILQTALGIQDGAEAEGGRASQPDL